MSGALLEARGLRVGYGAIPVLQGIDFEVEEGKTTVLLGLNGAGKTTTVASVAGLLKPSGGTISFQGRRIDGSDPAVLVDRGHAGNCGARRQPRPEALGVRSGARLAML